MSEKSAFTEHIDKGYASEGAALHLGSALLNGHVVKEARVKIPLKTLNRHGLIAGATGTGKTITIQVLAENMAQQGIPVLLMDVKGDLSGIARAGIASAKTEERCLTLGIPFTPKGNTCELFSLSRQKGIRLRATVSEFGPVLFSKILELNNTQSGVVALLFKYADDHQLPLLDLADVKSLLQYAGNEGKEDIKNQYGNISPASMAAILRKVIELESQGAELFFGERSFEVNDLLRCDSQGKGIISIIRLNDIQDRPKLFSCFMLQLLAEVYSFFPEAGDLDQPRLCIFIDEAHLVFSEASKTLLSQLETIIKLIRSKGIGVFFCTQNPYDIPDGVLSQLGLKVQHALRAFTEKDRKAIKKTAENYPISEFYKTDELLTNLGIGQALITALNEKGIPGPLAAVHLRPPMSRIGILDDKEIEQILNASLINTKYNEVINRESAHELLLAKLSSSVTPDREEKKRKTLAKEEAGTLEKLSKNTLVRQAGRAVVKEIARGLLGVLGLGGRSKGSLFTALNFLLSLHILTSFYDIVFS